MFYDDLLKGQDNSNVAFLDGFDWGRGSEVVIHCIRPNAITTARVLNAMKERIEAILGRNELPINRITQRIRGIANG